MFCMYATTLSYYFMIIVLEYKLSMFNMQLVLLLQVSWWMWICMQLIVLDYDYDYYGKVQYVLH
jgi:hypothetical protein